MSSLQGTFSTFITVMLLLFGGTGTIVQAETLKYSEHFDSDPGWITDQPENYYWESGSGTFHATTMNDPGGTATPTRYAYVPVNYDGHSMRLEFDIRFDSVDWSAGVMFGLFDQYLNLWPSTIAPEADSIFGSFGRADGGMYITLYVCDSGTGCQIDQVVNVTSDDTWYHCTIEYSTETKEATLVLRDIASDVVVADLLIPNVSQLKPELDYLGFARDPSGNNCCPSCSGYACSNSATVSIDNVAFSEATTCGIAYSDQVDTEGYASGLALSPDGSKLYVAYWEDENNSRVQVFSLPDLTLVDTFTFGGYHTHGDVVVSGDGTRFFTTNYYYSSASQIDMADGDARTDLPTCDTWPEGIAMTPDKTKLLVTAGQDGRDYDMGNDCISVYDIADGAFATLESVPLQDEPRGNSFGISQDSRFAYVATRKRQSSSPKLYEVSLDAPIDVTRTLDFPETSYGLAYTRCLGDYVYVSDPENMKIWVVNRTSWTKVGYQLESAPWAMEIHPSGAYLFVLMPDIGSVVAIDVASMSIVARYDGLSSGAHDIEFNNDGTKMYIAHRSSVGEVMAFDINCNGPGRCGDGVLDPNEACDDGNNVNCDGCRGDCSAVETGCGDGFLCPSEECDDGNNVDYDGCSAECTLPDFQYRCVALARPSAEDHALTLPEGLITVEMGQWFYLELWATDIGVLNTGVTCAYADLAFSGGVVSCGQPEVTPLFDQFPSGTCASTTIDELGGCQLAAGTGLEPEWVRVAVVPFFADTTGMVQFSSLPADTESSAVGRGLILPGDISYGTSSVEVVCPCVYDLDDNCNIAAGDLGLFAPCWSLCEGDPEWDTNNCGRKDFDCSGCVSGGDLGWFAGSWQKSCGEIDPTSDYPACRTCDSPVYCSDGPATVAGTATEHPMSRSATDTTQNSSVLLSFRTSPFRVLHPGDIVSVEVVAADMFASSEGLTAVYTDVHYDPDQLEVVSVDSGETYTVLSHPVVGNDAGEVVGLGGATMEPDHGVGTWTVVGTLDFRARVDTASPEISVEPSAGEAVSRYRFGLVPRAQIQVLQGPGKPGNVSRAALR